MEVYTSITSAPSAGDSLAELDREMRAGLAEMGYPGQPSHPICHGVGAEPTSLRTHTRRAAARSKQAWCCDRARGLLAGRRRVRVEDNFLITEGAPNVCRFPDGIVSAQMKEAQ